MAYASSMNTTRQMTPDEARREIDARFTNNPAHHAWQAANLLRAAALHPKAFTGANGRAILAYAKRNAPK